MKRSAIVIIIVALLILALIISILMFVYKSPDKIHQDYAPIVAKHLFIYQPFANTVVDNYIPIIGLTKEQKVQVTLSDDNNRVIVQKDLYTLPIKDNSTWLNIFDYLYLDKKPVSHQGTLNFYVNGRLEASIPLNFANVPDEDIAITQKEISNNKLFIMGFTKFKNLQLIITLPDNTQRFYNITSTSVGYPNKGLFAYNCVLPSNYKGIKLVGKDEMLHKSYTVKIN